MTEAGLLEFVGAAEKLGAAMQASGEPFPDATSGATSDLSFPAPVPEREPKPVKLTSRYSREATAVARLISDRSEGGRSNDPLLEADDIRQTTGLSGEDIAEAVHELERDGLVHRHQSLGMGAIGFHVLGPETGFFELFDPLFGIGAPVADARVLARAIVDAGQRGGGIVNLADSLGWKARRMNPALSVLVNRDLVIASSEMNPVW